MAPGPVAEDLHSRRRPGAGRRPRAPRPRFGVRGGLVSCTGARAAPLTDATTLTRTPIERAWCAPVRPRLYWRRRATRSRSEVRSERAVRRRPRWARTLRRRPRRRSSAASAEKELADGTQELVCRDATLLLGIGGLSLATLSIIAACGGAPATSKPPSRRKPGSSRPRRRRHHHRAPQRRPCSPPGADHRRDRAQQPAAAAFAGIR